VFARGTQAKIGWPADERLRMVKHDLSENDTTLILKRMFPYGPAFAAADPLGIEPTSADLRS
jgi:hypothetical protein